MLFRGLLCHHKNMSIHAGLLGACCHMMISVFAGIMVTENIALGHAVLTGTDPP